MSDLLIEGSQRAPDIYDRVWGIALKLRDSSTIDFSGGRESYGNLLHELEKSSYSKKPLIILDQVLVQQKGLLMLKRDKRLRD